MHVEDVDLQHRRLQAVRAWTAFVEHGDGAEPLVRPEIFTSWERSGSRDHPRRPRGAVGRRGRHPRVLAGLAAADRCGARRGGPAAHRRGRGPRARRHRRRHPDPLDLRRPGDATQGRDGELRGRRALGRRERRHQRPRPGQPARPAGDGVLRRALRPDRAQLGVLGRARQRPGHRPAARRDRPVDDLGPHPPDRPGDRAGDGAADRAGDAALPPAPRTRGAGGPRRRRAVAAAARHRRGPLRRAPPAAEPPADRDPRAARHQPRGRLARTPARPRVRRPGSHAVDAEGRGLAPALLPRRPAHLASLPADDAGDAPTSTP